MANIFSKIINDILPNKETWTMAKSEEEGNVILLRVRNDKPRGIQTHKYPNLINLYWHYNETTNNGLPPNEVYLRMKDLEDRLDPIEKRGNGFLVLSITGNQRKEWIWYTQDVKVFLHQLNRELQGELPFPIEIETSSDPMWEAHSNIIAKMKVK